MPITGLLWVGRICLVVFLRRGALEDLNALGVRQNQTLPYRALTAFSRLGLGQNQAADGIVIFWPSGAKTKLENVAANQMITIEEEKGVVLQKPFPTKK